MHIEGLVIMARVLCLAWLEKRSDEGRELIYPATTPGMVLLVGLLITLLH